MFSDLSNHNLAFWVEDSPTTTKGPSASVLQPGVPPGSEFKRRPAAVDALIYMTNLAMADLLYVLTLPPLIISNAMGDLWPFGNIICKTVRFFFCCQPSLQYDVSHLRRPAPFAIPSQSVRLSSKNSPSLRLVTAILPTLVFAHTGVINNMTVCFEMTNPSDFKVYFPYCS